MSDENQSGGRGEYLGKIVMVGITRVSSVGESVAQLQYHGRITSIADDGIQIRADAGKLRTLPPAIDSLQVAPPGEYREHSSGAIVTDPDLISTWEIRDATEAGDEPTWSYKHIRFLKLDSTGRINGDQGGDVGV